MSTASFDNLPGMHNLPYDFGENLESEAHRSNAELLTGALHAHFADQPEIYVGANMAIYFSAKQVQTNNFRGPDVFVVKGAAIKERKSWVVWEEDCGGPDVVIELLSDTTRHVDMGEKMTLYARQLRVSWYYLFDPDTLELHAWERDNASNLYVACPRDTMDRVACPALGLLLGRWTGTYNRVERTWLRWFLPNGELLPVGPELAAQTQAQLEAERLESQARLEAERQKAEAERSRAEKAEAALAALQARLAALGLA